MRDTKIKDEFISTLSHEIRTPLTSIKGFSKTILDNWEMLDETSKKKFLKIILEQSQRLINLVENVLDVAKINSGVDIVTKEVDLEELVFRAVDILKISYKNKKVKFSSSKALHSLADKDKLEQIFVNVIENAFKYSTGEKPVEIKIENKSDFNIVTVKNYGSYIDEDDRKKIFEKFFRTDSYLTSRAQGSGLGLYIAKNLIEKMKGKIEINSNKDENFTEFLIYIPIFEPEAMTKKITEKQRGTKGGQN